MSVDVEPGDIITWQDGEWQQCMDFHVYRDWMPWEALQFVIMPSDGSALTPEQRAKADLLPKHPDYKPGHPEDCLYCRYWDRPSTSTLDRDSKGMVRASHGMWWQHVPRGEKK